MGSLRKVNTFYTRMLADVSVDQAEVVGKQFYEKVVSAMEAFIASGGGDDDTYTLAMDLLKDVQLSWQSHKATWIDLRKKICSTRSEHGLKKRQDAYIQACETVIALKVEPRAFSQKTQPPHLRRGTVQR